MFFAPNEQGYWGNGPRLGGGEPALTVTADQGRLWIKAAWARAFVLPGAGKGTWAVELPRADRAVGALMTPSCRFCELRGPGSFPKAAPTL